MSSVDVTTLFYNTLPMSILLILIPLHFLGISKNMMTLSKIASETFWGGNSYRILKQCRLDLGEFLENSDRWNAVLRLSFRRRHNCFLQTLLKYFTAEYPSLLDSATLPWKIKNYLYVCLHCKYANMCMENTTKKLYFLKYFYTGLSVRTVCMI